MKYQLNLSPKGYLLIDLSPFCFLGETEFWVMLWNAVFLQDSHLVQHTSCGACWLSSRSTLCKVFTAQSGALYLVSFMLFSEFTDSLLTGLSNMTRLPKRPSEFFANKNEFTSYQPILQNTAFLLLAFYIMENWGMERFISSISNKFDYLESLFFSETA